MGLGHPVNHTHGQSFRCGPVAVRHWKSCGSAWRPPRDFFLGAIAATVFPVRNSHLSSGIQNLPNRTGNQLGFSAILCGLLRIQALPAAPLKPTGSTCFQNGDRDTIDKQWHFHIGKLSRFNPPAWPWSLRRLDARNHLLWIHAINWLISSVLHSTNLGRSESMVSQKLALKLPPWPQWFVNLRPWKHHFDSASLQETAAQRRKTPHREVQLFNLLALALGYLVNCRLANAPAHHFAPALLGFWDLKTLAYRMQHDGMLCGKAQAWFYRLEGCMYSEYEAHPSQVLTLEDCPKN